ncbi:proline iminopeptidase [Actinocrispum wychmicini]|uniref:Proline iminopeptidase n=2 Tax=Actinocrispum wychmicini TaxID=1213861 RepID=A0A4R2JPW4_9PSEU|nr:proline iminopeptidase [Actinocrispum wychmicini]
MLPVGDGHSIYWETSGNPSGKPALYLHGGPGGGLRPGYRSRFDPEKYLIIGFDQRGCGHSRPLATHDETTLATNTTQHLIADIEALRTHLGVPRWLVNGVSWGTTLALAYAQAHPSHVSAVVLAATSLSTPECVEWITETVGCLFPAEWEAFRSAAAPRPGQRLVDAYYDLLTSADPQVRIQAAAAWMAWEDAHVSMGSPYIRKEYDPEWRQVFATLVVHYWKNAGFLSPTALRDGMPTLHGIPGVLIQGKLDVSSPAGVAWDLHKAWPGSQFVLVDDEGHGGPKMIQAMTAAFTELA